MAGGGGKFNGEGIAHIAERGAVEATLIRRIRETHALSKRLKQVRLFGQGRTLPEAGDPPHLQVLLEMAANYAELPNEEGKLRTQTLGNMASLASSIDNADAKQFSDLLNAVTKKQKDDAKDADYSEADLEKLAEDA